MRQVEYSDSDSSVDLQRERVKATPVGARVKVLQWPLGPETNFEPFWFRDGIVIDRIDENRTLDGWKLRAGSMKVWFDRGTRVKWFSPRKAAKELCLFQSGEVPPQLSGFG